MFNFCIWTDKKVCEVNNICSVYVYELKKMLVNMVNFAYVKKSETQHIHIHTVMYESVISL